LRERGDDLELLAKHFLAKAARDAGVPAPTVHPSALEKLRRYGWPGNVREMRNVMYTAVGMCRGPQGLPAHLGIDSAGPAGPAAEAQAEAGALANLQKVIHWAWDSGQEKLFPLLHDLVERELLRFALDRMKGNQTQVAERLGMARGTVITRVQKYWPK